MCSRAAFSAAAAECASMSSSSTPRAAPISGRSGSTSPLPTSSTCRTKSSRGSPTRSSAQLFAAEARRAERKPNPDSMDLIFQGWAWLNKGFTLRQLCHGPRLVRARRGARSRQRVGAGRRRRGGHTSRAPFPHRRSGRAACRRRGRPNQGAVACARECARPSAAGRRPDEHQSRLRGRQAMRAGVGARSKSGRRARANRHAASFASARPRRPRLMSRRRCASVPATRTHISGACLPGWPNFTSARRRRRSPGCAGRSKPTGVFHPRISFWRPLGASRPAP